MKSPHNSPWTVGTKFRGELTEKSTAIVMNNSIDRNNPNKKQINYFITENIELLAGLNTVALFKIKRPEERVLVTVVEEVNVASLLANYKNKNATTVNSGT